MADFADAGAADVDIVALRWALSDTSWRNDWVFHNLCRSCFWLDMGLLYEAMSIHIDGMYLDAVVGVGLPEVWCVVSAKYDVLF